MAAPKRATRARKRSSRKADEPAPKLKPKVEKAVRPARGEVAKAMLHRFVDADLLTQAAGLAFWAVLSLPPLLLLLLWMVDALAPQAQDALMGQISSLAGDDARVLAQSIVDAAHVNSGASAIGGWGSIAWLFVGATAVFAQLQDALNRVFRTDATHLPDFLTWLRKRIFTFGLVFAVGFLLLVSLTLSTALGLVFGQLAWMLPVMKMLVDWLVYGLAFALTFHFLPDRRVHWASLARRWCADLGVVVVGPRADRRVPRRDAPDLRLRFGGGPGIDAAVGLLRVAGGVHRRPVHGRGRRARAPGHPGR
jgi:membrane protein